MPTEVRFSTRFSCRAVSGRSVTLPEGMRIDLGGIAKGYICDCIADSLRARGVTSALLNFGGNVVTVGNRPDGEPWKVYRTSSTVQPPR